MNAAQASTARLAPSRFSTDGGRAPDLVLRLRAAAARLVPFSESRLLLKEAAAMIDKMDRERAQREAQAATDAAKR